MPDTSKKQQDFSRILLKWNLEKNTRQMPWKGEKDPYKIWLSEIILQQTRVEQGLSYYNNFIKTFPDVHKLARAPEEKVFKTMGRARLLFPLPQPDHISKAYFERTGRKISGYL
ncbi:MAG: hypothetical protein WDO16_11330 [Bacteroidota bacterium]